MQPYFFRSAFSLHRTQNFVLFSVLSFFRHLFFLFLPFQQVLTLTLADWYSIRGMHEDRSDSPESSTCGGRALRPSHWALDPLRQPGHGWRLLSPSTGNHTLLTEGHPSGERLAVELADHLGVPSPHPDGHPNPRPPRARPDHRWLPALGVRAWASHGRWRGPRGRASQPPQLVSGLPGAGVRADPTRRGPAGPQVRPRVPLLTSAGWPSRRCGKPL